MVIFIFRAGQRSYDKVSKVIFREPNEGKRAKAATGERAEAQRASGNKLRAFEAFD